MRNWFKVAMIATAVGVTAVAAFLALDRPIAGQTQEAAYKAPRLVGTAQPDLNGIWQALTTANWDILDHSVEPGPFPAILGAWGMQPSGQGIVEGNVLPYKPEALEKKKANYASRTKVDPFNLHTMGDPEAKCYAPGVPRAMYMPYPFQVVQMPNKILMVFGYSNVNRFIQLDKHEEAPIDLWMGWSNGKWEGDTLVVDVTGFNGHTWLDRSGNFTSDALHVVERYTMMGPNTIHVRSHGRRSERLYQALEDEFSALSPFGKERPDHGKPVRGHYRGIHLRESGQKRQLREKGKLRRSEMRRTFFTSLALFAVVVPTVWFAACGGGAPTNEGKATDAGAPGAPLRTAWGDPDLQGVWENLERTPLERPKEFGTREFMTEEEAAARAKRSPTNTSGTPTADLPAGEEGEVTENLAAADQARNASADAVPDNTPGRRIVGAEYNSFWNAPLKASKQSLRTSQLVQPERRAVAFLHTGSARDVGEEREGTKGTRPGRLMGGPRPG